MCEPTASSCFVILPLFLFSYFLLYLPLFHSLFSLLFSRFHSHIHNVFSLSVVEQGKHTSPQHSRLLERFERERGQRRKGAPVSECSSGSGDSTPGSSHSVCLFYASFTRGSMYTDTQEPCCSAAVFSDANKRHVFK